MWNDFYLTWWRYNLSILIYFLSVITYQCLALGAVCDLQVIQICHKIPERQVFIIQWKY